MHAEIKLARRVVETARREPLGMLFTFETISSPRPGPMIRAKSSESALPEPSNPGGIIPEAMTAWLLPGGVLAMVIGLGAHSLYHWAHLDVVAQDTVCIRVEGAED